MGVPSHMVPYDQPEAASVGRLSIFPRFVPSTPDCRNVRHRI